MRATQAGRSLRHLGEKAKASQAGRSLRTTLGGILRWHSGSADHSLVGFHPGSRAQGIAGTRAQRTIERWNSVKPGLRRAAKFCGGMLVSNYGGGNADVLVCKHQIYIMQNYSRTVLFAFPPSQQELHEISTPLKLLFRSMAIHGDVCA